MDYAVSNPDKSKRMTVSQAADHFGNIALDFARGRKKVKEYGNDQYLKSADMEMIAE